MTQKNEAPVLIASLLITAGLLGGGIWWFLQRTQSSLLGTENQSSPVSSILPADQPPPQQESATFAAVQGVPAGLFNYGGSTTWAPIRGSVDVEIQKAWSTFRLRYTDPITGTPGSGSGIRMLLNNQLVFTQSSRSVKPEQHQEAQQRGFTLKEIPVAIDSIAVAVHPDLDIPGLTLAQLRDIYTGQITNWNQVGGPNLSITPYSRRLEDGGTVEFFRANVLAKDTPLGQTVQFVGNTTLALRQLSADRGGIYYASAPEVVGQCGVKPLPIGRQPEELVPPYQLPLIPASQCPNQRNQLDIEAVRSGQYPLTRRLFVIVKQNSQIDEQAGEAYANLLLTAQGQELLSQAGFVPIR